MLENLFTETQNLGNLEQVKGFNSPFKSP